MEERGKTCLAVVHNPDVGERLRPVEEAIEHIDHCYRVGKPRIPIDEMSELSAATRNLAIVGKPRTRLRDGWLLS